MRALAFLAFLLPAIAQIGAPSLGYVADGTRLRPVSGIPASASVGATLETPAFAKLEIAPGQPFALAVREDSGELVVYRRSGGLQTVPGAALFPDSIRMSPTGTAAALWFASAGRIQIVRDLPGSPSAEHVALVDGPPSTLAVSDDGQVVAGIWGAEVRTFGPEGRTAAYPVDTPRAIAFLQNSHELAVATAQGVFQMSDTPRLLHSSTEASSLAFASGNRKLLLATGQGLLTAVNLEQGTEVQTDCACNPEGFARTTNAAFRITGLRNGAYLLFNADTGEVLAVPLTADQLAAQEVQ